MKKDKKYTLEEAYAEILRIKNEMGMGEYHSKECQLAYERGYQQAVIDLNAELIKRSDMLLMVNVRPTLK